MNRTRGLLALVAAFLLLAARTNTADEPALGVYHWANGTAGVDSFAAWLDRPAVWGLDFVGGETWDNVQWPTWWLFKEGTQFPRSAARFKALFAGKKP